VSADRAYLESFGSAEHRLDAKRVRITIGESISVSIDFVTRRVIVNADPGIPVVIHPEESHRSKPS